jgi:hypothetical protein
MSSPLEAELDNRNALNAAIAGKTASPLTELRDSYFPRMSFGWGGSRRKRSMSVKTSVTGLEGDQQGGRPMTPGGILDAYARDSAVPGEVGVALGSPPEPVSNVERRSGLDMEASPRRKFFGRILGEGEYTDKIPHRQLTFQVDRSQALQVGLPTPLGRTGDTCS